MKQKIILDQLKKMFPNANLNEVVGQVNQMLQGKTEKDVPQILKELGISQKFADDMYMKFGSSTGAKTILSMMGTNPEELYKDSSKLFNTVNTTTTNINKNIKISGNSMLDKYPSLK